MESLSKSDVTFKLMQVEGSDETAGSRGGLGLMGGLDDLLLIQDTPLGELCPLTHLPWSNGRRKQGRSPLTVALIQHSFSKSADGVCGSWLACFLEICENKGGNGGGSDSFMSVKHSGVLNYSLIRANASVGNPVPTWLQGPAMVLVE